MFTQNSVFHALKRTFEAIASGSSSSSSSSNSPAKCLSLQDCLSLLCLSPMSTQKEFSEEVRKVISWATIQRHSPEASESTFGDKSLEWIKIEPALKVLFFRCF